MYIVRTSVDNIDSARLISEALILTHTAVSVHISQVESMHAWDGRLCDIQEFELSIICNDLNKTKEIIMDYHNYQLPEFIYHEVKSSTEIKNWCDDWCKGESK